FFDRGLADQQGLGDAVVRFAFGHGGEDVAFAGAEAVQGAVALATAEHPSDHFGVQRAAAAGDAGDGVDEALEIADAFFEEVADSFGALADQIQRVALLVVLREDKYAGSGSLSS